MLIAKELRPRNGDLFIGVESPYPSIALALHTLASSWLVRYIALALTLA